MKTIALVAAICAAFIGSAHADGIGGDTVNVKYYYPNTFTQIDDFGTQVVSGSGATFVTPNFNISVTDSQIIVTNFHDGGWWSSADFNGFVVTDLTKNFSAYALDPASTMVGLSNANVTNLANSVSVNWQGLAIYPSPVVILNAVPEPETYAMLLAGLGLIGVVSRRRINKPAFQVGLPVS